MNSDIQALNALIAKLNLAKADKETFFGKYRGFPIALKSFYAEGKLVLLFHIRHPLDEQTVKGKFFSYDERLSEMAQKGQSQISVEDKIAWLTFFDGAIALKELVVIEILDDALAEFQKQGLLAKENLCHYCGREHVEAVTYANGKVAQICTNCLGARIKSYSNEVALDTENISLVLGVGCVAALVGAIMWAGCWIAHDLLFLWLGVKKIFVPRLVEIVELAIIGGLVGGPIGFCIRKIPRRGKRFPGMAAIVLGIFGIMAGEVLFCTWLVYRESGAINFTDGARALPISLKSADFVYLVVKSLAAIVTLAIAYELAKPKTFALDAQKTS